MTDDIHEYVRTCDKCQRKKTIKLQKTQVSMKSIPIPQKIFGQVGIDLIQMVESQGYKYILTFCVFFTKWPELIPLPDKKATTIAKELYSIFMRFGFPDVLISDRGTEFCNAVSEAIFMYMGVEHRVSSPYHPQTNGNLHTNIFFNFLIFPVNTVLIFKKLPKNRKVTILFFFPGMVEKLNITVLSSLRACTDKPTDWVDCLQSVAMSIRSQPHKSTGLSPYEMMFGIPMCLQTELEDSEIPESATQSDLAQIMPKPPSGDSGAAVFTKVDKIRQIIHNSASGNISIAKSKQMYYFNQRHRGTSLQLHDKVLHYNCRAGQRLSDKLHGKWLGPYEIVGIKPNSEYQLKDSSGYVLKTYVNASNSKLYLSPNEEKEKDNGNLPDIVHAQDLPPPVI